MIGWMGGRRVDLNECPHFIKREKLSTKTKKLQFIMLYKYHTKQSIKY